MYSKSGCNTHGAILKVTQTAFDEDKLAKIYLRVVEKPNLGMPKKGFIRCPDCGEEILMIHTLRVMQQAIENHVCKHKNSLKGKPIKRQQIAILVRLSLMSQVLHYAYKPQKP